MASVQMPNDTPLQRVLLVDDNRDAAEFLAALLRMDGHEVALAFDGEEALGCATAFQPEAALIDIGLPGMNGYEVAEKLRDLSVARHMLLVAVTGWGSAEDQERATKAGFDRYLTKPIEYDAVQSLLQQGRADAR